MSLLYPIYSVRSRFVISKFISLYLTFRNIRGHDIKFSNTMFKSCIEVMKQNFSACYVMLTVNLIVN